MKNKEKINFTFLFARNGNLEYSKLEKALKINENKSQKFDFLYAIYEAFYFFEKVINEIFEKWNKKNEMTEPEFLYTAIAFKDAIEKIDYFAEQIKSKKIPKELKNVVKNCIFNYEFLRNIKKFDWDLKVSEILENLGAINFKVINNKNQLDIKKVNVWEEILNNIRNKLVHPNSVNYKVIHTGGNYSPFLKGINKKFFQFHGSFANKTQFLVRKDIFLRGMLQIQEEVKKMIPTWNKKIKDIALNKIKFKIPSDYIIEEKLKTQDIKTYRYDPMLIHQFEMIKLYKAYEITKDKFLKKFIILKIQIHHFFNQAFNDNFEESWLGKFSLYNLRSEFIKETHKNSLNNSSATYANEKIGHRSWSEEEIKLWFPGICARIDSKQPGIETYEIRLYAIISKKINWKEHYEETKKQFENWKKLKNKELFELEFK